ncbi:MAG: hypothetical protein IPG44_06855 [Anaerolineales bacterium]|nr:hypothetical protein [Anaerolineales bacterium]
MDFPRLLPDLVLAQQPTDTPAAVTGLFITVTTTEPQINVRLGLSSTVYPVVGTLLTGSTALLLVVLPGGDWIQIEFAPLPAGRAGVYSPLVQVSPLGSTLQIVEPPPTPVPPATSTIDPTLAAQFIVQPTGTRLPTYTPAPTLAAATFEPLRADLHKRAVGFHYYCPCRSWGDRVPAFVDPQVNSLCRNWLTA